MTDPTLHVTVPGVKGIFCLYLTCHRWFVLKEVIMDTSFVFKVLECLPMGLVVWSVDQDKSRGRHKKIRLLYANEQGQQYTGICHTDTGKTIGRFLDTETVSRIQQICEDVLTTSKPLHLERFKIKDSSGVNSCYTVNILPIDEAHICACFSPRRENPPALSNLRDIIHKLQSGHSFGAEPQG